MAEALAIQPIGFHVQLASDWRVSAVSTNIADFLPVSVDAIIGQSVTGLFSESAIHDIRNRMALLRGSEAVEHLFRIVLVDGGEPFDLSIRHSGSGYGLDAERCSDRGFGDATGIIEGMLARSEEIDDVAQLCEQAARQVRALTGFDQVSVWIGEERIALSARRSCSRPLSTPGGAEVMIVDLDMAPVLIRLARGCGVGALHSALRVPSHEERDWLVGTGARAAVAFPLSGSGKPWGLICCQHQSPRHLNLERRNIARLFARILGLRLEVARLRSAVLRA
ncbi:MAG: GAF domain-containing protein [Sphingomonas sp.]|uniref:GAF domain-containing protein n=1 Tax=Sphingomonas sp. TaxID=28214 RepID=UPI001793A8B1|nr:GAF domain-containing protein [Sphingomonas sp.]MBA3667192.1 GAF domain-containing protein [Sphingomonas sp.]